MHFNLKGVLLLPFLLYAIDYDSLSKSRYWQILGHYKNNVSEIDSPEFFLSKKGKTSPKEELKATIYYLTHPKYKDDNSTYCKYPARREWIKKKLPNLKIIKQNCKSLNEELNGIKNIKSVTLIFPTILMNSPASMFGHTLLRLDDASGDYLNSFAINYAAQTNETNGLIYAFKGLSGGYIGKYAILPYYKKIAEYNDIKNRDIWEYTLNLTPQEIEKLKLHLMEIKNTWSYYYYFNKNCSYQILWLLEAARPNLELVYKFNYKVLPIDTIKEAKKENLISASNYRPSKQKIILAYFKKIKHKNKAIKFSKNYDFSLLNNLDNEEKKYILDFSIEMLNYKYLSKQIPKKVYLKKYIYLLKKRSKLGEEKKLTIKPPQNPIISHDSNKIWVYIKKDATFLGIKPAFHYTDAINRGFIPGAYIDFFKTEAKIKNSIKLNYFYFFNIKSLSARNEIFKPISWGVDLGINRFKDEKLYLNLNTSAFLTYKKKNLLYSFGLALMQYYKTKYYISPSPTIYLEYNFKKAKIDIDFKRNFFEFKTYNEVSSTFSFEINKDFNLNIGYRKNINENYFFAGFSLYFL